MKNIFYEITGARGVLIIDPDLIKIVYDHNKVVLGFVPKLKPGDPFEKAILDGLQSRIILAMFDFIAILPPVVFLFQAIMFSYSFLPIISGIMVVLYGLLFILLIKNPKWLSKILIAISIMNSVLGIVCFAVMITNIPSEISAFGIGVFVCLPAVAFVFTYFAFIGRKEIYLANHACSLPRDPFPVEPLKERWEDPNYDPMDDPLRMA